MENSRCRYIHTSAKQYSWLKIWVIFLGNFHAFVSLIIHLSPLCLLRGCRAKIATSTPNENAGTGEFKITTATNHERSSNTDANNTKLLGLRKDFFSLPHQFKLLPDNFLFAHCFFHTESNGYVLLAAFPKIHIRSRNGT